MFQMSVVLLKALLNAMCKVVNCWLTLFLDDQWPRWWEISYFLNLHKCHELRSFWLAWKSGAYLLVSLYIYIYIYIYIIRVFVVTKSLCGYVSNRVQYNMESVVLQKDPWNSGSQTIFHGLYIYIYIYIYIRFIYLMPWNLQCITKVSTLLTFLRGVLVE